MCGRSCLPDSKPLFFFGGVTEVGKQLQTLHVCYVLYAAALLYEVSCSEQDGFALQHTNIARWEVHEEGCLHNLNQGPEGECATQ